MSPCEEFLVFRAFFPSFPGILGVRWGKKSPFLFWWSSLPCAPPKKWGPVSRFTKRLLEFTPKYATVLVFLTPETLLLRKRKHTIHFKIITRMKLLFSSYLGDYSYRIQGSFKLFFFTVTASCSFNISTVTGNNSSLRFSRIPYNYSYII